MEIFNQYKSEIIIELADIKGWLVTSSEGIEMPLSQLKNAFSEAKHNEVNLALFWYFNESFL